MAEVLYVLTPSGERVPAKVNEEGELIVNVDATVASEVQIQDSNGNDIDAFIASKAMKVSIVDGLGNSIVGDNDGAAAESLAVKLVDTDGNTVFVTPTTPASQIMPVGVRDYLGAQMASDNNDNGNTSLAVKLLASNNKRLGQFSDPDEEQPIVVGDSNAAPIVTTMSNGQSDAINGLIVTGKVKQGTENFALSLVNIPVSDDNGFIGAVGSVAILLNPTGFGGDSPVFKKLKALQFFNKQFTSGINSGAIDIYIVETGTVAETFFDSLAIPDILDLNSQWVDLNGLLQVINGVAPVNAANVSMYSVDFDFIKPIDNSNVKIYIFSSEALKEFGALWNINLSYDYELGVNTGLPS